MSITTNKATWMIALVIALGGCARISYPPSLRPEKPRPDIFITHTTMQLGVRDFVDSMRSAGSSAMTVPQQLVTSLYEGKRFEILEREQLSKVLVERIEGRKDPPEAVVLGSITNVSASPPEISVDVRVVSVTQEEVIMYANTYKVAYQMQELVKVVKTPQGGSFEKKEKDFIISREETDRIARDIQEAFPRTSGKVVRIDGNNVTLDVGENAKLRRGLVFLVVAQGPQVKDEKGEVIKSEVFVGKGWLMKVDEKSCDGKLWDDIYRGTNVKVGDIVRFL